MFDLTLLPANPVPFFQLEDGYDRRDLKRAYGKAIRQFKPETHPDEFRVIRDAYERLENQLRYEKKRVADDQAAKAWETKPPIPEPHRSRTAKSTPYIEQPFAKQSQREAKTRRREERQRTLTLRELATIDPIKARAQLEKKSAKAPQDFFLAAILADVERGKPTRNYLRHLIDGLIAYPTDPGLTTLTAEYLKYEIPDDAIVMTLGFVARKLRTPAFYRLTEPLWIRLFDSQAFDKVENLLRQCESLIRQSDPEARSAFYLRILRSAIWSAPAQWTREKLNEFERRSAELDDSSQMDLEFLNEIYELQKLQTSNIADSQVRQNLLAAIQRACRTDDVAAIGQVLDTLTEIAMDGSALQTAFPLDGSRESDDAVAWVSTVNNLVHQLQTHLDEKTSLNNERVAMQTLQLVSDLQASENAVGSGFHRAQWRYKTLPLLFWLVGGTTVLALPMIAIIMMISHTAGGLISLVALGVLFTTLMLLYFRWLYPKILEPREEKMRWKWAMKDYTDHWRSRLFRFARSINEPTETQLFYIGLICRQRGLGDLEQVITMFVRRDPGLYIYSSLQTLLR